MDLSAHDAFNFLVRYMGNYQGNYANWFTGTAASPRDRLFLGHKVSEVNGRWAHFNCANPEEAASVESALREQGCKGANGLGNGHGSADSSSVYVYWITKETEEEIDPVPRSRVTR